MVSFGRVGSIGHILSKNLFVCNLTSAFTENVKAYNQFMSTDTYESMLAGSSIKLGGSSLSRKVYASHEWTI